MARHPAFALGVADGFHDVSGEWHPPGPATLDALLEAMGGSEAGPLPDAEMPLFIREGEMRAVPEGRLRTEDGALVDLDGSLPPDLPLGYHELIGPGSGRRLVVAPQRCHLPPGLEAWGLAVQLYSLHSARGEGIGDLADLRDLNRWAAGLGAGFLLLSPLHAALPGTPQEASPYYPSSRIYRNPLHLRTGRAAAPSGHLIDRDAVWEAKMAALEAEWERVREWARPEVEAYAAQDSCLMSYGRFWALSEVHGRPWRRWPEEFRHPGSGAVARFGGERRDRVLFAAWLQLQLDRQLAGAAQPCGLVSDLAVGVHPDGFDAWLWQDVLAGGVSVGAPPDPFNRQGQDWGLPPFDPRKLARAGFEPWRQTVRAALRSAAGVRIDHVMGLFRLYWIPRGASPADGAYVEYPARQMLDVLALESVRAGAFVVGEDLGTVQDEVRRELAERAVLSYRLLWFEPGPPEEYPRQSLAALTTHDLPTLRGVWSGEDPMPEVRARLGVAEGASGEDLLEAAARLLARAPSRLLAMTLEDLAGALDRPNRPGTTEPSNWSRRLPMSMEELFASDLPRRVATILARGGA